MINERFPGVDRPTYSRLLVSTWRQTLYLGPQVDLAHATAAAATSMKTPRYRTHCCVNERSQCTFTARQPLVILSMNQVTGSATLSARLYSRDGEVCLERRTREVASSESFHV